MIQLYNYQEFISLKWFLLSSSAEIDKFYDLWKVSSFGWIDTRLKDIFGPPLMTVFEQADDALTSHEIFFM